MTSEYTAKLIAAGGNIDYYYCNPLSVLCSIVRLPGSMQHSANVLSFVTACEVVSHVSLVT